MTPGERLLACTQAWEDAKITLPPPVVAGEWRVDDATGVACRALRWPYRSDGKYIGTSITLLDYELERNADRVSRTALIRAKVTSALFSMVTCFLEGHAT